MSYPNPIPPMTEEERAAFRSFLLRRYVLSILALVLGIAGAVLLLRRGVDGPPLMEAVWVCLFVLSGGTAVLGAGPGAGIRLCSQSRRLWNGPGRPAEPAPRRRPTSPTAVM